MFCDECLQRAIAEKHSCPLDHRPIEPREDIKDVSKLVVQLLSKPKVYCVNRKHGCDWNGPRGLLLPDHRPQCEHTPCQNATKGCSWTGLPSAVSNHVDRECPAAVVRCQFASVGCSESVRRDALPRHVTECAVGARHTAQEAHARRVEARKSACARLNPKAREVVALDVGGRLFKTTLTTLRSEPQSLLAQLFNEEQHKLETDEFNRVSLDCDGDAFAHVLQWLRFRVIPSDGNCETLASVFAVAKALELDELLEAIGNESKEQEEENEDAPVTARKVRQVELLQLVRDVHPNTSLNLSGLDLRGCTFYGLGLSGCPRFVGANMSGMDLRHLKLSRAWMSSADLSGADLSGADLSRANLSGANLMGANLTGTDLTGANVKNARLDEEVVVPPEPQTTQQPHPQQLISFIDL